MRIQRSSFATWSKKLQGKDKSSKDKDKHSRKEARRVGKSAPGWAPPKESKTRRSNGSGADSSKTSTSSREAPPGIDTIEKVAATFVPTDYNSSIADFNLIEESKARRSNSISGTREPGSALDAYPMEEFGAVKDTFKNMSIGDSNFVEDIFERIENEVVNKKSMPSIDQEQRDDAEPSQVFADIGPSLSNDSIMEWMGKLVDKNDESTIPNDNALDEGRRDDVDETYSFLFSDDSSSEEEPEAQRDADVSNTIVNHPNLSNRMAQNNEHGGEQIEAFHNNVAEGKNADEKQTIEQKRDSEILRSNDSMSSSESSSSEFCASIVGDNDVGYQPINEQNEISGEIEKEDAVLHSTVVPIPTPMANGITTISQFASQGNDLINEMLGTLDSKMREDDDLEPLGAPTPRPEGNDSIAQIASQGYDLIDEILGNMESNPAAISKSGSAVDEFRKGADSIGGYEVDQRNDHSQDIRDEEFLQGVDEQTFVNSPDLQSPVPNANKNTNPAGDADMKMSQNSEEFIGTEAMGEAEQLSQTVPISRKLSKPKISPWGRKKRLKKHEQIKEKQGGVGRSTVAELEDGQAQSEHSPSKPKQEQGGLSLRKITKKNKERQRKRAFGRIQPKAKNTSSIDGVSEKSVASAANEGNQSNGPFDVTPIQAESKSKREVSFKPELVDPRSESRAVEFENESDDESVLASDVDSSCTEDSEVEDGRKSRQDRKRLQNARRQGISLALSTSDLSDDELETCACREAIEEGPILCNAMEKEEEDPDEEGESGCRVVTYDLVDMATELVYQGPTAILGWLD